MNNAVDRFKKTAGVFDAASGTMAAAQMTAQQNNASTTAPRPPKAAESTIAAANMVGQQDNAYQDDGGWSYIDLGDGRIQLASVPATSKLKAGQIIDPENIAKMPDGAAKMRAARAYNSIRSVMMGAAPLEQTQSGGKKVPAGGAAPGPTIASSAPGPATDPTMLRMQKTPEDAPAPGISAVSPPPAAEIPKPGSSPGRLPNTKSFLNNFR